MLFLVLCCNIQFIQLVLIIFVYIDVSNTSLSDLFVYTPRSFHCIMRSLWIKSFQTVEEISDLAYSTLALNKLRVITFAFLNIKEVSDKLDDIKVLLTRSEVPILSLEDIFLNDSIDDSEICVNSVYRCDRAAASISIQALNTW